MTRPRLALPLFFLSGAVALACEGAWFRALGLLFGASLPATGALLAAFMAGLAAGSALGAHGADRLRSPLRWYGLAEGFVGLYALASPALFALVREPSVRAGTGGRLALAFALLALPTCAMGASLPLLVAAVRPSREALRRGVAALYGVNLAGAATGALLAGFVALPRWGGRATLALAGSVALGVCAVALLAGRTEGPSPRGEPAPRAAPVDGLAVALAASLGALSFALQVCWNRALGLVLGSSSYTFSLVVAVILAGSAVGGIAGGREEGEGYWPSVARRCLGLGIAVYLGALIVRASPFFLAWSVTHGGGARWPRVALVALVVGAPSYLVGALFPALASRYPSAGVGAAAGRALLVTTAGNLAGSLGAAFALVPWWGVRGTLVACSVAALALACVAALRAGWARFRATALAAVVAYLLAALIDPSWDVASLSAGTYRVALYRERHAARGEGCDPARRFTDRRVLYHRDGAVGAVVVLGHPAGPSCSLYSLRINGKAEGSVFVAAPLGARLAPDAPLLPVGDLPTEVLAGWLPGMAGPSAGRALLVGWGTGLSARALVETGPARVTAVELEPAVYEAARVFDAALLSDPRVTRVVEDARVTLAREPPGSLDVVASHPSNPWVSGATALFSREYFALARSRLRPGGRMLAWIQLYEIDREAVRSLVATFLTAFPDAHALRPGPRSRDLLLLGFRGDGRTPRAEISRLLSARSSPEARVQLLRAGYRSVEELLAGAYLTDGEGLSRYARGARVTTEDHAWLEFRVADRMLAGEEDRPDELLRGLGGDGR